MGLRDVLKMRGSWSMLRRLYGIIFADGGRWGEEGIVLGVCEIW